MQTGEYEIRRLTTFRVEFDGHIAACGANSTPEGEADAPPELLSSCSKRP